MSRRFHYVDLSLVVLIADRHSSKNPLRVPSLEEAPHWRVSTTNGEDYQPTPIILMFFRDILLLEHWSFTHNISNNNNLQVIVGVYARASSVESVPSSVDRNPTTVPVRSSVESSSPVVDSAISWQLIARRKVNFSGNSSLTNLPCIP